MVEVEAEAEAEVEVEVVIVIVVGEDDLRMHGWMLPLGCASQSTELLWRLRRLLVRLRLLVLVLVLVLVRGRPCVAVYETGFRLSCYLRRRLRLRRRPRLVQDLDSPPHQAAAPPKNTVAAHTTFARETMSASIDSQVVCLARAHWRMW